MASSAAAVSASPSRRPRASGSTATPPTQAVGPNDTAPAVPTIVPSAPSATSSRPSGASAVSVCTDGLV
jgi:hypothetical protein